MHEPAVRKSRLNNQANNGALFRQEPLDMFHVAGSKMAGKHELACRLSTMLDASDSDVIVDALRILCSFNVAAPLACLGLVFGNVD